MKSPLDAAAQRIPRLVFGIWDPQAGVHLGPRGADLAMAWIVARRPARRAPIVRRPRPSPTDS